jgi:hypothetical protein
LAKLIKDFDTIYFPCDEMFKATRRKILATSQRTIENNIYKDTPILTKKAAVWTNPLLGENEPNPDETCVRFIYSYTDNFRTGTNYTLIFGFAHPRDVREGFVEITQQNAYNLCDLGYHLASYDVKKKRYTKVYFDGAIDMYVKVKDSVFIFSSLFDHGALMHTVLKHPSFKTFKERDLLCRKTQ